MTLVDILGNPLMKDDLVCVTQGDQQLIGIVLEIREPSLIAPGKDQMHMPGVIQIGLLPLTLAYDVRNPRLTQVIKVVKPPNFKQRES
jgi:hypothetical protein